MWNPLKFISRRNDRSKAIDNHIVSGLKEDIPAKLTSDSVWKIIKLAPIIIGAVFIGLSLVLEHPYFLGKFLKGSYSENEFYSTVLTSKMLILFVAEIGYAFIIAGIVSSFLEANAKREQVELFKIAQDQIKRNVFEAVYRIKHSENYIQSVIGTCFESPLVRENYRISYEIDEFPEEDAKQCGVDRHNYVLITANVNYVARNMGPDFQNFPTGYGIPFRPGPLEKFATMRALKVGTKTYKKEEIDALEKKTANEDHTSEKLYQFEVPTNSGSTTEVAIEVSLLKEISDNDAFGFRRPTIGASIQFINRMERIVAFGVTPRTSATLRETRPRSLKSGEWEIDGPILPFDSVILWWRKPGPETKKAKGVSPEAGGSDHNVDAETDVSDESSSNG